MKLRKAGGLTSSEVEHKTYKTNLYEQSVVPLDFLFQMFCCEAVPTKCPPKSITGRKTPVFWPMQCSALCTFKWPSSNPLPLHKRTAEIRPYSAWHDLQGWLTNTSLDITNLGHAFIESMIPFCKLTFFHWNFPTFAHGSHTSTDSTDPPPHEGLGEVERVGNGWLYWNPPEFIWTVCYNIGL